MSFRQAKRKMMPTGKLNIPWIAARITERQLDELASLARRRNDPRRVRLEKKRGRLAAALEKIDAEIARLAGGARPAKVPARRPGRKPGRPAKAAAVPARRGRQANTSQAAGASPVQARQAAGKRGLKAVKPAQAAKAKRPVTDPARRAKLLENLAKARAARAAKRDAAQSLNSPA